MPEKIEDKEESVPAGVAAEATPSAPRRSNGAGGLGFALALIGLLFFWVPVVGVVFWFLGLLFSFAGVFSAPRGFAFSGVAVSALACGFILFLAQGRPFEYVIAESSALFRTEVADGTYVRPARKATDAAAESAAESPAPGVRTPRRASAEKTVSSPGEKPAAVSGVNAGTAPAAEEEGGHVGFPPFPVARFEEISRRRSTWPSFVKLTCSREITLWNEETKEIMGKMVIPAGSVVEVIDVRSGGVLEALDCTGQRFKILAADTNFSEAYTLKNVKWGAE